MNKRIKELIINITRYLPDDIYIKVAFRFMMNSNLNIKNPKTFNEKLQWLKLYNRDPQYSLMVDKYEVKKIVADKIGEEYIIPTLAVWDSVEKIQFNDLPGEFVLKSTNDSGTIIICSDKQKMNWFNIRKILKKGLNTNYYFYGREWPYKNVKPRIIAEKYIKDERMRDLQDYKFFCFNGIVKIILVCSNRFSEEGLEEDFFSASWEHLDLKRPAHNNSKYNIAKPLNLNKMIQLAEKLSVDIPFVRVDFYDVDGKIYFGEMTFFPSSGFVGFVPEKWDELMGEWIILPDAIKDKCN